MNGVGAAASAVVGSTASASAGSARRRRPGRPRPPGLRRAPLGCRRANRSSIADSTSGSSSPAAASVLVRRRLLGDRPGLRARARARASASAGSGSGHGPSGLASSMIRMPSPSAGGSTLVSSPAGSPSKVSRLRRLRPRRSPRSTGGIGLGLDPRGSGSGSGASTTGTSPDSGLGDSSTSGSDDGRLVVDDRQVDEARGADLLVELLERRLGLLLDAPRRRVGREPRVGQRGGELVGRLVDRAAHHRVRLEQPLAPRVELLDLLARLLATHARSRSTRSRTACASATISLPCARAASSASSASSRMRSSSRWPSSRSDCACSVASARISSAASWASALAPLELPAGLGE